MGLKILPLLLLGLVLFSSPSGAVCCVCPDGTCAETATTLGECVKLCRERGGEPKAYVSSGYCWSSCQPARDKIKLESQQKGKKAR